MGTVYEVSREGKTLAHVVPPDAFEEGTKFVTPDHYPLQMGLLSYGPGEKGEAHWHPDRQPDDPTHQEAIVVLAGNVEVEIYDTNDEFVEAVTVEEGGAAFFADGGRGWTATEDTRIIELNLGPYLGLGDNKVPIEDE